MVYIRIISGEISKGSLIRMMVTNKVFDVLEVGVFTPHEIPAESLKPGEVGYMIANIKNPADVSHGFSLSSQKASSRPHATYARSSAADPARRTPCDRSVNSW